MTNREQQLSDELYVYFAAQLPSWNLIRTFDVSKYETYYKDCTFLYIFDPVQQSDTQEEYENSQTTDYDTKQVITCYIGFGCKPDVENEGLIDKMSRDVMSKVEKAGRLFQASDYKDADEKAWHDPMKFNRKASALVNSQMTVGLSIVEFTINTKVILSEQN